MESRGEYTRARAQCPDCGEVVVPLQSVVLRRNIDDDTWSYRMLCPDCGLPSVFEVTTRLAELIHGLGLTVERWSYPVELLDRPCRGNTIQPADLKRLVRLLDEEDWFDRLLAMDS